MGDCAYQTDTPLTAAKQQHRMEIIMGISVGMLIFGLFDGSLAYAVVYCLLKSRFKGGKIGRILGTILGTITFAAYIALFVWFDTTRETVNPDFKRIIYAAPIVLSVLLSALVLLSQPPKQNNMADGEEDGEASDEIGMSEEASTAE